MTLRKRLQKIETSLTPKEAVFLWLKEMLELSHETYVEKMFADPRNPRVLVARTVGEAIRENLSDPPLEPELLEQAVRKAQKEADMLIVLLLDLHDHVRSKCELNSVQAQVVDERFMHLLQTYVYEGRFEPCKWDSWRALLSDNLIAMRQLRETVASISDSYYDSHPLLFAADEEKLNGVIVRLEDLTNDYNSWQNTLPDWKPIYTDAHPSLAEHYDALVALRVSTAQAKTLKDFGETEAARKLLDSNAVGICRMLNRLRSSSSPQTSTSYFPS